MKMIFLVAAVLTLNTIQAQIFSNSIGEGVFYAEKAKQFKAETKISEKSTKIEFQGNAKIGKSTKYYFRDSINSDPNTNKMYTLLTSKGLLGKLSFTNRSALGKGINNPQIEGEIGFFKSVDELNINLLSKIAVSYSLRAKVKYNNRESLYDTISQVVSSEYPFSYSINSDIQLYRYRFVAAGFTFGFINNTNFDDLTSFQNLPASFIDDKVVSISEDFNGKIGMVDRLRTMYFSASFAIFPFSNQIKYSKLGQEEISKDQLFKSICERLTIIPYTYSFFMDKKEQYYGVSLSIVDNSFNNSYKENYLRKLFNRGFSLGVDWKRSDGQWSGPNYFISGTLSLDGIISNDEINEVKK